MRSAVVAALLVVVVAMTANPMAYYYSGSVVAPSEFITMAASDLAAMDVPDVYLVDPVDTTTVPWAIYDVTCESDDVGCSAAAGSEKFLAAWGCSPLNDTGSADNAANWICMMEAMGDDALAYFPNGTYHFDTSPAGNSVWRPHPNFDHRGVVCESNTDTHIVLNGLDSRMPGGANILWMEFEDPVFTATTVWDGGSGAARGDTVITVASTTGFVAGNWVNLTALINSTQDGNSVADRKQYKAKIASVDSGTQFTIDRPLPIDINGGSATAQAWSPVEEFVIRDCRPEQGNPAHLNNNFGMHLVVQWAVEGEVSGNHFVGGYKSSMLVIESARMRISGNNATDSEFDKGPNTFAFQEAAGSDNMWFDNATKNVTTGFACSAHSVGALIAFNDFDAMDPNAAWDPTCDTINNPLDDPDPNDPNDCDNAAENASHALAHGIVLADDPGDSPDLGACYLHCSSNNLADCLGLSGGGSCQGTRSGAVYSSAEWHDDTCSASFVIRNRFGGGPFWMDFNSGPGQRNFFNGNHLVAGIASYDVSPGQSGSFHLRGGSPAMAGYFRDDDWANNIIENVMGSGEGLDFGCVGCEFRDNVIVASCLGTTGLIDGGDCADHGSNAASTGTVWADNTVGANEHGGGYSRTMPTAPGFGSLPTFSVVPESNAPFVGPEMGDPTTYTGCLPARQRLNGGTCP